MDEIKKRALALLESMPAKVDAASWNNAYGDGWNDAVQLCTDEALPIVMDALQEAENYRADKMEMFKDAKRHAEEAGRLAAELSDARLEIVGLRQQSQAEQQHGVSEDCEFDGLVDQFLESKGRAYGAASEAMHSAFSSWQQGVPEGWALVPKIPSKKMVRAGVGSGADCIDQAFDVYDAMISAAPSPDGAGMSEWKPISGLPDGRLKIIGWDGERAAEFERVCNIPGHPGLSYWTVYGDVESNYGDPTHYLCLLPQPPEEP